jgi:hypothetical protein
MPHRLRELEQHFQRRSLVPELEQQSVELEQQRGLALRLHFLKPQIADSGRTGIDFPALGEIGRNLLFGRVTEDQKDLYEAIRQFI